MFRNISRHFGGITDTRVLTDPWGLGIEAEIIRSDLPAWKEWLSANGFDGEEYQKELLRLQVQRGIEAPAGKRMKKGGRPAGEGRLVDQVVERMHAKLRQVTKDTTRLEKLKDGLASVAIKRIQAGLVVADALCACGHTFEPEHGDDACPGCGQQGRWETTNERAIPDSVEARRKLLSNPRDSAGDPLWVPATKTVMRENQETGEQEEVEEDVPFGGQPVGDAIASWLLDGMEQQEKFRKEFVEGALGNSAPAPDSSPASGEP